MACCHSWRSAVAMHGSGSRSIRDAVRRKSKTHHPPQRYRLPGIHAQPCVARKDIFRSGALSGPIPLTRCRLHKDRLVCFSSSPAKTSPDPASVAGGSCSYKTAMSRSLAAVLSPRATLPNTHAHTGRGDADERASINPCGICCSIVSKA